MTQNNANYEEKFHKLLEIVYEKEASDLHMKTNKTPKIRINGDLHTLTEMPKMSGQDLKGLTESLLSKRLMNMFIKKGSVDFSYQWKNVRLRINIFMQRGTLSFAIRFVNHKHLNYESYTLPGETLTKLAGSKSGLILVVGPSGCGKSTTLATMIQDINENQSRHIITIEDPVEFVYEDKKSYIQQREIGQDALDFDVALTHILRQDPNVILVGEMRDQETVRMTMKAALTGHLVFSTLHTLNAKMTIERISAYFKPEERESVRQELGQALKGVISQRLIKSKEGQGRVPFLEILVGTKTIAKLLRENKLEELHQVMQNREAGMQTYDQSLVDLYQNKLITLETALDYAEDPSYVKRASEGRFSDGDRYSLLGNI